MAEKSKDTIRYNLYRLRKESQGELIKKLESVNLALVGTKNIDGFELSFYFSRQPDIVGIWWADTYKDFFEGVETPQNQIYFAVLLISTDKLLYAISLGKSHFYLKPFCDSDFGLDLAQRIADNGDVRIKTSKLYKTAKSKIITTFQKGSRISYDSGESMHYLKLKTLDEKAWGRVAAFGGSVQLSLPLTPSQLPTLINRIEQELAKPPLFEIPKAEVVRGEDTKKSLDKKLAEALLGRVTSSSVNVEEFSVSGVDFIFSDRNYYSFFCRGHSGDKEEVGELTIEELVEFAQRRQVDLATGINDILVYCENEQGKGHSEPLKCYLDYVDEDRYCLIDGKWHRFNASYVKYLESEVDSLSPCYDQQYDIRSGTDEDSFNSQREISDGFVNLHKNEVMLDSKYRVEFADLYGNETLFFVKIGNPQKMAYVVDQALSTLGIVQNNAGSVTVSGGPVSVKTFSLWMILDRRTKINKLSEVNSIIFHMKLVDWKKAVMNAGYKAEVRVNYVL